MIKVSKCQGIKVSKTDIKIQDLFKNLFFYFILLPFAFCILNLNCYAQSISSTELIENAKQYDGKTVTYTGEVVGEVMLRKTGAWVNIGDEEGVIGIWIPFELIDEIAYKGDYKTIGDWIEIKGIFHRACPEHGGDLDIHAQSLRKMKSGEPRENMIIDQTKKKVLFWLLGVLCIVLILRIFIRK